MERMVFKKAYSTICIGTINYFITVSFKTVIVYSYVK